MADDNKNKGRLHERCVYCKRERVKGKRRRSLKMKTNPLGLYSILANERKMKLRSCTLDKNESHKLELMTS